MWFPSSLELTEAQDVSRAAQISQQIYQKQMSITEDMDEQAGSQEAVQPWVFLHPDESPPAGHLIASLFYKWRKWSELNTQREKDWICMDLCSDGMHVLSGICLCFIWIVLSSCSPCLESNDWLRVTWKRCTQCSCAAGAINPAVELSGHQCRTDVLSEFAGSRGRLWHIAPTMEEALKQKCDYWVCWASTSLVTLLKDKVLDCVSSLIWSRRGFIPEPGCSAPEWHRAVLVRTSLPRQV